MLIVNPVCVLLAAVAGCLTTCYVARQEMSRRLKLKKFEAIESAIKQLSCKSHIYLNYISLLQRELTWENIPLIVGAFEALTLRLKETVAHDADAMVIALYISGDMPNNDLRGTIQARDELIRVLAKASALLPCKTPLSDAEMDEIKQKMELAIIAFRSEREYLERLIEKLRVELRKSGLTAELFESR